MTQPTLPSARPGWATSEFSTVLGTWLGVQAMPEHLVWPTVAVACTYILSRAIAKLGCKAPGGEGGAGPSSPSTPPAGLHSAPATPGLLGFGRALAPLLLAALALTGCQALESILAQPVQPSEVTVTQPDGTQATGAPVPAQPEPVAVPLPDGAGEATYTPPPAPEQPTVGSQLAQGVGSVVGAVTGQPAVGAVIGLVLASLLSRRRAKATPRD